jgi:predicted nuclease of predicted toxin-antitoxin system
MKLLLDENLPKRLKADLLAHEVFTVRECGWNGKTNGALLAVMLEDGFDVLITFDKNLKHQQNFSRYPIPVIVLNAYNNTYLELSGLIPKLLDVLAAPLTPGPIEVK